MKKRSILSAGLAAAAVAVIASGCTISADVFTHRSEDHFTDFAEFEDSAELVFRDNDWVPSDATDVAVAYLTRDPGNMMTFTSADGVTADDCVQGTLDGAPKLEAIWWPSTQPEQGTVCGGWQVFNSESTWYAWTN